MKGKLFLASALAVMACGSAFAAGKTADEVRIYINPGHGSWGSNDRPMNTLGRDPYTSADPDTTGFYESNTNLHKGFSLLDHLVEAGVPFDRTKNQDNTNPARLGAALDLSQHIVMSHVKAGPYPITDTENKEAYNRPLSEIREEVEANNFDIFISIHSNAASEGSSTNYPLYLYRGYDNEATPGPDSDVQAAVPGSRDMALHIWPYSYSNEHQTWSYYSATNPNVRGDVNFYGSGSYTTNNGKQYYGYLGVLKHGVPGFLVEGYFHTYQPARQRAMNDDVCRHEGHLYARGLIDYMGWKAETTGDIYGIVRDLHERFSDPLYSPASRTNDIYKPLNGVTVTLLKDGQPVKTYKTDNEWNGAFLFTDLEPGTYSLSYSAEGYKEAFEEYLAPLTVAANETTYVSAFLEAEGYVPPAVIYENYPDPLAGNKAYGIAGEYNMQQVGEEANPLAEQLAGKTIRRQIVRNGHLYVLALDEANEPYIYNVNLADNTVATVSTAGLTLDGNKDLKISDIAFSADNVLLACSYGENQFSNDQVEDGDTRGEVAIYKWANDENGLPTGNPATWFTSQNSGNYYNAMTGRTLAYSGTIDEGEAIVTAQTVGSSTSMRFVEFAVSNGALASTTFINNNVSSESNWTENKLGADYQLVVSPQADNQFVIDGSLTNPTEWQTAGQNVDAPLLGRIPADMMAAEENGATFFKYADHDMMVAPAITDGKVSGVKLFDVTNGFDNAVLITTNGATITPEEATYASAAGVVVTTVDSDDNVTAAHFELYLIRNGKVSKFSAEGVEQPVIRGEYAYSLAANVGDTNTEFSFKSTGAVPQGNIILKDSETGEVKATLPTGAIVKGDNKVTVANTDIPEGELAWEVEVIGQQIGQPTQIFSDAYGNNRGVVIDMNPASKYFGTTYVGNTVAGDKAKGLYKYDQNLQLINTTAIANEEFSQGNTASPFRMGMLSDGTVLITDWSDAHAGLYMMNPETDEVTNMFAGERAGSGAFTYEGNIIGGGTTGVSATGEGENLSIYTFCEDYPTGNAGNKLVRYDIGTSRTIMAAPNAVFDAVSSKLVNTNVEVRATENGIWASQTRSKGNNTADVPSLVYTDLEGNILYNSGTSNATDLNGSNGSGFAINLAGDKLAIVNGDNNVNVYELTWNENVPTLDFLYTFTNTAGVVNEMAFDVAGNLYLASNKAFQVWALPTEDNSAVTPAVGTILVNESSVDEVAATVATTVYPNPATDVLNVKAGEAITSVAVYNMSGAMVIADGAIDGNNASINVSSLTSGIYFVKINGKEAVRFIKK